MPRTARMFGSNWEPFTERASEKVVRWVAVRSCSANSPQVKALSPPASGALASSTPDAR